MSATERQEYKPGDVVFSEGEAGKEAYLVEDGQIEISKTIDGKRVVLGKIEQGGVFGEMALVDDAPRMATAVATQKTALIVMSDDTFKEKLARSDPFIRSLLRIFAQNIRVSTNFKKMDAQSGGSDSALAVKMARPDVAWILEL